MPNKPPRPCRQCGRRVYRKGLCSAHHKQWEDRRGTSSQRGYDRTHRECFRREVLKENPACVLCNEARATHADHYPLSRRELIARGLNPNDPRHGRGLCPSCHSKHTARAQSGWSSKHMTDMDTS